MDDLIGRLPHIPPLRPMPDNPVDLIRGWSEAEGLELHAHTVTLGWQGEPLDVRYAIDVLHPLARNG